jgi:hypothetical protein
VTPHTTGGRKKARRTGGEHGTTAREREGESGRGRERGCAGATGEDVGGLGGRDGALRGMTRGTRVGPAHRRRRQLGRALAVGFKEGASALGGPRWDAQAWRGRGHGPRREVGWGKEGCVALGRAGEADGPRCSSAGPGRGGT